MNAVERSIKDPKSLPYLNETLEPYDVIETSFILPEARELFRRVRLDQTYRKASEYKIRKRLLGFGANDSDMNKLNNRLWDKILEIDNDNRLWLKATLENITWFKSSKYGAHASNSAWLLVQHGDSDIEWQKKMLKVLKSVALSEEVSLKDIAYLEDRISVSENKPQTYGTQGRCEDGNWNPFPIKSPDKVDIIRKQVGLNTLKDYQNQFASICEYK